MNKSFGKNGSVILIVIFAIALLSTIVIGMVQLNTEEIQLVQNQVYAAEALCVAEAGLNDAFGELRADSSWIAGFVKKAFGTGNYSVTVAGGVPNLTVESSGTSGQGFVSDVAADITIGVNAPYTIRVDELRINGN